MIPTVRAWRVTTARLATDTTRQYLVWAPTRRLARYVLVRARVYDPIKKVARVPSHDQDPMPPDQVRPL